MRRGGVILDRETGMLHFVPSWPPTPYPKDRWIRKEETTRWQTFKRLSREVIAVEKDKVSYKNQDGEIKVCSIMAFRKWCERAGVEAERLADWKVSKEDGKTVYILKKRSSRRRKKSTKKKVKQRA